MPQKLARVGIEFRNPFTTCGLRGETRQTRAMTVDFLFDDKFHREIISTSMQ
jgi:hypothetical protein